MFRSRLVPLSLLTLLACKDDPKETEPDGTTQPTTSVTTQVPTDTGEPTTTGPDWTADDCGDATSAGFEGLTELSWDDGHGVTSTCST